MPRADDVREMTPGQVYDARTRYWIRGQTVMYGDDEVRLADAASFRFYLNGFAKDRKYCYCVGTRLREGSGSTFRALNNCYATDGQFVWALGGRVKDADAASFEVCDDGVNLLGGGPPVPHGYGKDRTRVYYYDFDGTPNWVRKATPASFQSFNDGHFARDSQFVFCGTATLPGAKPDAWRRIDGYYSKDDRRIYYFNRHIKAADYASFEVVAGAEDFAQLARDKNNLYINDEIVTTEQFAEAQR